MNGSRREFIKSGVAGSVILYSGLSTGCIHGVKRGETRGESRLPLDTGWWFGGKYTEGSEQPGFDDRLFEEVTIPHCVRELDWKNWNPDDWHHVWIYRRMIDLPALKDGERVFLEFEGVMKGVTPFINGRRMEQHLGGYLPCRFELTPHVRSGRNVLACKVDSRWLNVPPQAPHVVYRDIDFLQPGGVIRPACVEVVPEIYLADLFAMPMNVLEPGRKVRIHCTLDSAAAEPVAVELRADLRKGRRRLSTSVLHATAVSGKKKEVVFHLDGVGDVELWHVDHPALYDLEVTLLREGRPLHRASRRIGFREAKFEKDGFYLNGERLQIFGLNKHELFPYTGFAMPERVIRKDAEILKHELNCNMVRCAHYPHNQAFLNACDELGLLVWEEIPGWQYIGDDEWKALLMRNVRDMVVRGRSHPSVILWGVRSNETDHDPDFYRETKRIAKTLDPSRQTTGNLVLNLSRSREGFVQDVMGASDYSTTQPGQANINKPVVSMPYLVAETGGQFNYGTGRLFDRKYRRDADLSLQQNQAIWHAQAHDRGLQYREISGVLGWLAYDYASLRNDHEGVKRPGVCDMFRIPKLGASFYLSQVDPSVRPVIEPNFYWDFSEHMPKGPGRDVAIFSNCDRLVLFVGGERHSELLPARDRFPNLPYAPFFADLDIDGAALPELRIEGFVGSRRVLSKSYCADRLRDQLTLQPDDQRIAADGVDATRVVFKAADRFGEIRLYGSGAVRFELEGPGVLVGNNPFLLEESGGVGAVWVRSLPRQPGRITLRAAHAELGAVEASIRSVRDVS